MRKVFTPFEPTVCEKEKEKRKTKLTLFFFKTDFLLCAGPESCSTGTLRMTDDKSPPSDSGSNDVGHLVPETQIEVDNLISVFGASIFVCSFFPYSPSFSRPGQFLVELEDGVMANGMLIL